jgi:anti-sigma B factor antagonist
MNFALKPIGPTYNRPHKEEVDSMGAKVRIRHVQGFTVLEVSGRITLGEGGVTLRDAIQEALKTGTKTLILNMGEVTYMDSSGVGELTGAYVSAKNQGSVLKLVNLTKKIDDLMQVTKLATIFDLYSTEEDALAASNA